MERKKWALAIDFCNSGKLDLNDGLNIGNSGIK